MKRRIPTYDEYINEGTWNNQKYGFRISKFLEQYVDKKLTGVIKMEIIFNDFFKLNTYSYVENLLICAKIERYIKSYKITEHSREIGKYMNAFTIEVDVVNWYEFLRKLDDGHLENVKVL